MLVQYRYTLRADAVSSTGVVQPYLETHPVVSAQRIMSRFTTKSGPIARTIVSPAGNNPDTVSAGVKAVSTEPVSTEQAVNAATYDTTNVPAVATSAKPGSILSRAFDSLAAGVRKAFNSTSSESTSSQAITPAAVYTPSATANAVFAQTPALNQKAITASALAAKLATPSNVAANTIMGSSPNQVLVTQYASAFPSQIAAGVMTAGIRSPIAVGAITRPGYPVAGNSGAWGLKK